MSYRFAGASRSGILLGIVAAEGAILGIPVVGDGLARAGNRVLVQDEPVDAVIHGPLDGGTAVAYRGPGTTGTVVAAGATPRGATPAESPWPYPCPMAWAASASGSGPYPRPMGWAAPGSGSGPYPRPMGWAPPASGSWPYPRPDGWTAAASGSWSPPCQGMWRGRSAAPWAAPQPRDPGSK